MKAIITLGLAILLAGCCSSCDKPNEDFGPYGGEKSKNQQPQYK